MMSKKLLILNMLDGGIYIHVPFCRNKCIYCDFYSGGQRIAEWDKYIKAILCELVVRKDEVSFKPSTLYIGGGTPSLIPSVYFEKLIDELNQGLGVNHWQEFTIEVNPEDISEHQCKVWKNAGVNRISIGIQSLNDTELKMIGRKHSAQDSIEAFNLLKNYFDNISVDLMFGIPHQSLNSYIESLQRVIDLKPTHVSSYSLMLEPGTAMTLLVEKEKIKLPDEDEWMKMFQTTHNFLKVAGYDRYEISNYALPGYRSIHNSSYWDGKPYLGLGPSAHSYDGYKMRRANLNDIKKYIKHFSKSTVNINEMGSFYNEEILNDEELKEEFIMTRLRRSSGFNIREYAVRFGENEKNILLKRAQGYISGGLMKCDDENLSFTDSGFEISDTILSHLI